MFSFYNSFFFPFSEFRSQLPHEGGAFYSSDTMDTVRKYYKDAWPPVLNAATLWLCHGGFEETSKLSTKNLPHNLLNYIAQSNRSTEEINSNFFHLIFGNYEFIIYSNKFICIIFHNLDSELFYVNILTSFYAVLFFFFVFFSYLIINLNMHIAFFFL